MRQLVGLAAAFLLSCAPAASPAPVHPSKPRISTPPPSAPPQGISRAPSSSEQAILRELMLETEALRGLRFRAPVEVRIQDRQAVRAYVKDALEDEELTRARRRYVALGLLDASLDIRELIESLMEEELIGYYDPKQKILAVREDVASSLAISAQGGQSEQWKATVVHELVHALQDQHLGLSNSLDSERTTDEENAFGALVEGDATLAMLGYLAKRQGSSLDAIVSAPDELATALQSGQLQAGGRLARAPAVVREPLLFRYREGAVFAARLYARGGWEQVNEAHRAPPLSTLAIRNGMYPEAHATARVPEPPTLVHHDCKQLDDDVLGSLEVAAALASDRHEANSFQRAWRGDRYVILDCASQDASVWLLRFSTPQVSQQARKALGRLQDSRRRVLVQGRSLLIARNVPDAAAPDLASALGQWVATTR